MSISTLPSFASANVSAVTDRILVGGDLSYDDETANAQALELYDYGVTHIVDCRIEADDMYFWSGLPEIRYLHHGMDDAGQVVPDEWFDTGVEYLQEALRDPEAIVLTHCHMGINRGPSLGFALLLAEGWDPVEAITAIRRARPISFVWYAEQALGWHHRRTGASVEQRKFDRLGLEKWWLDDDLDVANVIRKIRIEESR